MKIKTGDIVKIGKALRFMCTKISTFTVVRSRSGGIWMCTMCNNLSPCVPFKMEAAVTKIRSNSPFLTSFASVYIRWYPSYLVSIFSSSFVDSDSAFSFSKGLASSSCILRGPYNKTYAQCQSPPPDSLSTSSAEIGYTLSSSNLIHSSD